MRPGEERASSHRKAPHVLLWPQRSQLHLSGMQLIQDVMLSPASLPVCFTTLTVTMAAVYLKDDQLHVPVAPRARGENQHGIDQSSVPSLVGEVRDKCALSHTFTLTFTYPSSLILFHTTLTSTRYHTHPFTLPHSPTHAHIYPHTYTHS